MTPKEDLAAFKRAIEARKNLTQEEAIEFLKRSGYLMPDGTINPIYRTAQPEAKRS